MRSTGQARLAGDGFAQRELPGAGAEDLRQDNHYDFIVTLDCIHDMPRPAEAIAAIRRPSGQTARG